jgi:predicted transposase YdaD
MNLWLTVGFRSRSMNTLHGMFYLVHDSHAHRVLGRVVLPVVVPFPNYRSHKQIYPYNFIYKNLASKTASTASRPKFEM